ncbi:MAG: 50S ribosomal protein L22 [Candidatus Pacebacteria bacterium]|nr:50S ribosomal protein L22 [Candidatus Paceibacterota bacterium]MBP9851203.1 50S ribosomal protein L22 [Candidatus Paceibacterota bacterium]
MKAYLKNYRQSPRKVRLVASLVTGKKVSDAIVALEFLPKRASLPIKKLLLSALANAKAQGKEEASLFIKELRVDKGIVMKRMMPRAMGRGARINKRTSHVNVLLAEKTAKLPKAKKGAKKEKTEVKKEIKSSSKAKKPAKASASK